jgi:hypothetical protein
LYLVLLALVDEGDEVLLPNPGSLLTRRLSGWLEAPAIFTVCHGSVSLLSMQTSFGVH